MATHAFNHPADIAQGGTWYGDYGRHMCRWTWDNSTKSLQVICGLTGKHIDLSGVDLTAVDLRERLPQIAFEAAEAERVANGQ